jgi:hypothetical protein
MFIGKNRNVLGDRPKSPSSPQNINHAGRRLHAVRRVDQAFLKRHVVPIRTGNLPKATVRKYENSIFEDELQAWKDNEQLPPYRDTRFDIPPLDDRVNLGRKRNIPRRIRKDAFRTLGDAFKIDTAVSRSKLKEHSYK